LFQNQPVVTLTTSEQCNNYVSTVPAKSVHSLTGCLQLNELIKHGWSLQWLLKPYKWNAGTIAQGAAVELVLLLFLKTLKNIHVALTGECQFMQDCACQKL
jgi:ABC-type uncharacterized transport system permease subunit